MRIKSILVVAIIAMAMLVAPASAGENVVVDGNVKNSNPFFWTESYTCPNYNYDFTGVSVYSIDDFIIKNGGCRVDILATAGDWNGQSDIESFEFEITKDNAVVVARNAFDTHTPLSFPFTSVFAMEGVNLTEAGTYKVTIYVDDGTTEIERSKTFTIKDTPMYEASDLHLNNIEANKNNSRTITVKNNWGSNDSYVQDVEVHNITVTTATGTFTIPTSCISVEPVPSGTFGVGESVTLTVYIDTTGMAVPKGTISSDDWVIAIGIQTTNT